MTREPTASASLSSPPREDQRVLYKARWIARHWRPYLGEAPLIVVLTLANAAVLVVYPYLLKRIIDGIAESLDAAYLAGNAAVLVAFGVVHFVVYAWLQTLRSRLNLRFEFGVRLRAFEHLLDAGPTLFGRFRTGDLVTRLMDDVSDKLSWFMCSVVLRLVEALAIEVACLGDDLAEWPEGLNTRVGTRGARLSGGQKHRVALARALAGRPAVLLLDDCTAALDAHTEEALWQRLAAAIPGCATILVTHRPATLRRADQVLVLDRGRVVERGAFAELERPGTLFHRLYVQWTLAEAVADDA